MNNRSFYTVYEAQGRFYIKFVEPTVSLKVQTFDQSGNDPGEVIREFKKFTRFKSTKRIDNEKLFQYEISLFQRDLDRLKSWNNAAKERNICTHRSR